MQCLVILILVLLGLRSWMSENTIADAVLKEDLEHSAEFHVAE